MKRWLLVDSKALMFRCHEGYTVTLNDKNMQVQGIIGYLAFVQKLETELEFEGIIHFFDSRSKWRLALYPEYKANRPELSPEAKLAFKSLNWLLPRMGELCYGEDGQEADDLIATMSAKLAQHGDSVLIWSPDKDLSQLIEDDKVAILKPKTRLGEFDFWTESTVLEKIGVHPKQIPDFLALVGDSSDHIPGVPGFGKKKAAAALTEHGNLLTLIQNPPPGTLGQILTANKEEVMLWHQLTLLPKSLPMPSPETFIHPRRIEPENWMKVLPMNPYCRDYWLQRQAAAAERNRNLFADDYFKKAFDPIPEAAAIELAPKQTIAHPGSQQGVDTAASTVTAAVKTPKVRRFGMPRPNIISPP